MSKYYYKDGTVSEQLFLNGILHRIDGPAIEYDTGATSYYINDLRLSMISFNNHPEVIAYKADKAIRELLNG